MRAIQTLVQTALDPPGRAIVFEPLCRVQLFRGQTGHERHDFGTMVAQVTPQQGDLFHAGKAYGFRTRRLRTQYPNLQAALVNLTRARQVRCRLPRGKNPPVGR